MIIICPNCKKKFNINTALVPDKGRDLQCGSCKHVWLYKIENDNSSPLTVSEDFASNESKDNLPKKEIKNIIDNNEPRIQEKSKNKEKKITETSDNKKAQINKESTVGKFFSYIIVFIVSFVALIILIDTLKTPLINIFPGLEIVLFSLFEMLQDIKLFIIDLY
jgi:predicted Zn finger-like uncharacterized protein